MFDLEPAIAEWRRQMLASGIQTPVPLEELEIHLREEIRRQVKSGLDERDAFDSAVQKIGQPDLLKKEFKNAAGFVELLCKRKALKRNCILGLIWLVFYGNGLLKMGGRAFSGVHDLIALVGALIFLGGMFGSVLLICDSKWGRSIIRTNALVFVVWAILAYTTGVGAFGSNLSFWSIITLCVVSILLLHWPRHTNSEVAKYKSKICST